MKPLLAVAALVLTTSTVFAQTPDGVGVKIAVFDPQIAFQQCAEGKAELTRLNTLAQRKQTENTDKQKQLQANQQKLQSGVLTPEARVQLERDIEKQQVELQRFQQDAQAEINSFQENVQTSFAKHLRLAVGEVAIEKGIHIVLNAGEPAIAWVSPTLDVTAEVVKKLDAKPALPHD